MWNPPDPKAFFPTVWLIVQQIPAGKVSTYGQIASMIPPPDGVAPPDYARLGSRWVGTAMNNTPDADKIPWQRVINSQGKISLPPGSPGAHRQRTLLEAEGIVFDESDRVDFNVYGWDGPPEAWRNQHGLFTPRALRKPDGPTQPKLF